MKTRLMILIGFVISILLLAGCNFPLFGGSEPTPTIVTIETVVAQTVAAGTTLVPTLPISTIPPTITPPPPIQPSLTPYPTYTPYPTQTAIPCDAATWGSDITIPDGTKISSGQAFTKTWRIFNGGSCSWTTAYKVVFVSGNQMSGTSPFAMPKNVAPGQSVDISVNLKAPTTAGSYTGNWALQNPSGVKFGLGASNSPFYVKIVVETALFAVTKVTVDAEHYTVEAACPPGADYHLMGHITTNGAGHVTYYWKFDDGTTSATKSLDFSAAGTKDVSTTYSTTVDGSHSASIYIDQPNHQLFSGTDLTLHCTP
jgi:Ig-like domain from next to BRCA1 gene